MEFNRGHMFSFLFLYTVCLYIVSFTIKLSIIISHPSPFIACLPKAILRPKLWNMGEKIFEKEKNKIWNCEKKKKWMKNKITLFFKKYNYNFNIKTCTLSFKSLFQMKKTTIMTFTHKLSTPQKLTN